MRDPNRPGWPERTSRPAWPERTKTKWRAVRLVSRYAYRADPVRTVGSLVTNVGAAICDVLVAVVLKVLVDAVVRGDTDGVLTAALFGAAALAGSMLGHFASTTIGMGLRERATLYFDSRMTELAAGVHHLEHYERPDYLDELQVLAQNHQRLAGMQDALVSNLTGLIRLSITVGVLAAIHPVLFLLPLAGVPTIIANARAVRDRHAIEDEFAAVRRLQQRLFEIGTGRDAGKELRLFGAGDEILARWWAARSEADDLEEQVERRTTVRMIVAWALFGLGFVGAELLVAYEAVAGRATVGDVVLALTMAGSVNYGVSSLGHSLTWLLENVKHGTRLVWLEDLAADAAARATPSAPVPVPDALTRGIALEDVSFRYPGTDEEVLGGLDLFLPAGATVAIVGDNGAGKTTLVKLLCRFYDPTTGRISVDGTDLRQLDVGDWRSRLSGCFQDFARLELLARETVGVGDVPRLEDDGAVAAALERAHAADVPATLPAGLLTQLGRSFEGGVEPSTGQWQKLALGRAMMREAPLLLLLDEPTASLDPDTEAALFERYAGAASEAARRTGAITLLVSHRFSTVRMADLIVVLGGGRVLELGSHDDLLTRGGTYAELYGLQARAYR